MTDLLLPGTLYRESEFQGNLTGACGPNALSMAASWSTQRIWSTIDVYQTMHTLGLCDANGVSNIGSLYTAAQKLGLPNLQLPSANGWVGDWPGWPDWFLSQLQAGRIVLFETSDGQALRDARTGLGENASGLQYHFLCAAGYLASTGEWVCLDGDNFAVGDVVQHYSDAVMSAAAPCAAIAIGAEVKIVTTTGAGPGFDAYCAANDVTGALRAYFPMGGAEQSAAIYDADPAHGTGLVLHWTSGGAVADNQATDVALWLYEQWQAAQAQVATLTAEPAAAKANPAPAPAQSAAPSQAEQSAVALVAAIRAALAA